MGVWDWLTGQDQQKQEAERQRQAQVVAEQARQATQEAAQARQRTGPVGEHPEQLERVQTPENERGPVPRLLNVVGIEQPRQPEKREPEPAPEQTQEATRMEYRRDWQVAPSIGGPGMVYVNSRVHPVQQSPQRETYANEIAQERREAENNQQQQRQEPRFGWEDDLLRRAQERLNQMTPEERQARERGNTRGRTMTRY